MTTPGLLILGIDGASWEICEPWIEAGDLPTLARIREGAAFGRVVSTDPPITFPAWTSFATGCDPAQHGIFDFTIREGYGLRFTSSRDRLCPSIWNALAQAGRRVCVYNLPASYPPEVLPGGIFIAGFDSPVTTAIDPSFVEPRELHRELSRRHGALVVSDLNEMRIGAGWHARALSTLERDVERRGRVALDLLGRGPWDVFFVLFGESDTAGHHFWRYHDPASPRFVAGDPCDGLRDGLRRVYQAIDRALGAVLDGAGEGAAVLVLSDHGMAGAGDRAVSLNRFLADVGLLRFHARPGGSAARALRALALRTIPTEIQGWLLRGPLKNRAADLESASRFAGIDWSQTVAFSEELNYFPSICLNLVGREPEGRVPADEREGVCRRVIAALEAWRDPATGKRIVARARPREAIHGHSRAVERAPDVFVDLALEDGYSTTVMRAEGRPGPSVWRLRPDELTGAKGEGMNGTHRRHGLWAWRGEGAPASGRDQSLAELGQRVLDWAGVSPLHGRSGAESAATRGGADPSAPGYYSPDQEAVIRDRLRRLGYLE